MKKSFVVIMVFFVFAAYPFIEPYLIQVNDVHIADGDIPDSFTGKRIVFISDIHCGPFFSTERVVDLVNRINRLEPDIVLLGGDYINGRGQQSIGLLEPCISELKGLDAPLGVYGVLGNHEHWADARVAREVMSESGIIILDNHAEWITLRGDRIRIGGVGDMWEDYQDISPTVNNTTEDDFIILLSHNPDYVGEITTDRIDLVLSGHTHGGQATLFGLWAPYTTTIYGQKYVSGTVETEYTRAFISRGIGTSGLPVRFFARPEIVLLILTGS